MDFSRLLHQDSKKFNNAFQTLCISDSISKLNSVFTDLITQIKPQCRLQIALPPFDIPAYPKPKLTPLQNKSHNDPEPEPIKPIPWRPNARRKQLDPPNENINQKNSNDPDDYPRKRKILGVEPVSKQKKLEEAPAFASARSLAKLPSSSNGESPKKHLGSGLKKPFNCPMRGSEAAKEESKISGIEEKLVEMIESEIITRNPCVKWSDIAGLDFAKKTVNEVIVWPLKRPDLFKGLRAPPKGLLLFGPPGTGKTMIGKAIASEVSATFFSISASSITSKWVGEGEKLVRVLFALAVKNQPSVIFIDEIDSLLSCRSDSEQEGSRRIKTEFLVQMDGAATNPDDRVLLIGATNRPQELDEAMRRRLSKRMYIPLPNAKGRQQILKNLLEFVPNLISEEEMVLIVEKSRGFSGSDMKNLCTEASMFPLRSIENIYELETDTIPPVQYQHFVSAFNCTRSSVSQADLQVLLEWNKSFGTFQFESADLET